MNSLSCLKLEVSGCHKLSASHALLMTMFKGWIGSLTSCAILVFVSLMPVLPLSTKQTLRACLQGYWIGYSSTSGFQYQRGQRGSTWQSPELKDHWGYTLSPFFLSLLNSFKCSSGGLQAWAGRWDPLEKQQSQSSENDEFPSKHPVVTSSGNKSVFLNRFSEDIYFGE